MAARKPIFLWDNSLNNSARTSLTATDTDADAQYDVLNVADWRPYTRWKALNGTGTKYITWGFSKQVPADTVAIVGHNAFSGSWTVKVQEDDGGFVDRTSALGATSDDQIIYGEFSTSGLDTDYRLEITTSGAAPEIGLVIVGVRDEVERYLSGSWDPQQQRVEATGVDTKSGELLGSVFNFAELTLTAEWRHLTDTYIRDTFLPMWNQHVSQLKPFIFSWRPEGIYIDDVIFARIPNQSGLSLPYDPLRRSLRLEMIGLRRLP